MKKIFRNSRIIALAIFATLSVSASANDSMRTRPVLPAEFKFAGIFRNNPVFELNIDGANGEDVYTISVTDTYGNTLYTEKFKAGAVSKKFLFKADELEGEKLYFRVNSRNTNSSATYEIVHNTRTVNETSVNLLK